MTTTTKPLPLTPGTLVSVSDHGRNVVCRIVGTAAWKGGPSWCGPYYRLSVEDATGMTDRDRLSIEGAVWSTQIVRPVTE